MNFIHSRKSFPVETIWQGGVGLYYLEIIGNISRSFRALLGSGLYVCSQAYAADLQFIKTYICISQTHKLHLSFAKQNN